MCVVCRVPECPDCGFAFDDNELAEGVQHDCQPAK